MKEENHIKRIKYTELNKTERKKIKRGRTRIQRKSR